LGIIPSCANPTLPPEREGKGEGGGVDRLAFGVGISTLGRDVVFFCLRLDIESTL